MFVIATQRADFSRAWEKILKKHGKIQHSDSLEGLLDLLRAHSVRLVVLDLEQPDSRRPAILRSLVQACGSGKLVLGGIKFEPHAELAGLAAGAVACCGPDLPANECKRIVEVILEGGVWLSSAGLPALVERLRNLAAVQNGIELPASAPATMTDNALGKLTRREREVAELVSSGANNKIIARKLLITDRTVKAHLTAIYDKLNVADRLQLALHVSAARGGRAEIG